MQVDLHSPLHSRRNTRNQTFTPFLITWRARDPWPFNRPPQREQLVHIFIAAACSAPDVCVILKMFLGVPQCNRSFVGEVAHVGTFSFLFSPQLILSGHQCKAVGGHRVRAETTKRDLWNVSVKKTVTVTKVSRRRQSFCNSWAQRKAIIVEAHPYHYEYPS